MMSELAGVISPSVSYRYPTYYVRSIFPTVGSPVAVRRSHVRLSLFTTNLQIWHPMSLHSGFDFTLLC